jgi:hypothetical protein
MHQEHRLGVTEANLVTRKLKLEPCSQRGLEIALQENDRLYGLDNVAFDDKEANASSSLRCLAHLYRMR